MARGNQREKAREANLKKQAGSVSNTEGGGRGRGRRPFTLKAAGLEGLFPVENERSAANRPCFVPRRNPRPARAAARWRVTRSSPRPR